MKNITGQFLLISKPTQNSGSDNYPFCQKDNTINDFIGTNDPNIYINLLRCSKLRSASGTVPHFILKTMS